MGRRVDAYDLAALLGLGLLGCGLWWIWPPLGLVVPGALLVAFGLLGAWASRRNGTA